MSNVGEIVTSVGNSWIICRSKSYVGRIYYFNTSTGEAAWNLSEVEVEKAKKRTQSLQCQPGFTMDNCPEPLDTPAELEKLPIYKYSNRQHLRRTPNVYNKQIINNQFSKPPDLYSNAVIQCSPMNPTPFNIPIASALNTGIWTVAPQQIFVTPSLRQSQPCNTYDIECVPVSNTSVTLTNRFKKIAEVNHRDPELTKDTLRNDTCQQKLKIEDGCNKNDLRLFLSLKRAENIFKNNEPQYSDCKGPIPFCDQYNDVMSTSFHNNEDDGCFEEDSKALDSTQEIEINSLRNFLQVKGHTLLYIVTDSNVLLNNVYFLNNLLRDNQCRLVVPRTVMNKIQDATNSRLRTYAHRAAYFVLQQVDANLAIIDETTEVNERNNDDIMNCCIKLINLGKSVVLLTDDIELHNSKNASNVSVLSVKEIKLLVCKYKPDKITNQKADVIPLAQNRSIKITIKNDVNIKEDENEQVVSTSTEKCLDSETVAEEKRGKVSDGIFEVNKKLHDVGIQTEFCDIETPINTSNNNNSVQAINLKDSNYVSGRTCGIQLKRHLAHDTLKMKNTGRKKLVWRRCNAKPSLTFADDGTRCKNDVVSECTAIDSKKNAIASPDCGNLTLGLSSPSTESLYKQDINNYDIDSETSSFINKTVKPHGNIEETSSLTSGMSCNLSIAESESILKGVELNQQKMENDDKNVMFEVTDSRMEENLRMKSDEWVSRFVQIMEEALTQVLHQDPPFVHDSMPPPWTIHEATECVKQKFHTDSDIVDAATKLLNISFENGGFRGKIKSNITPSKYMELYSYGVYLVDALQGLLNNNEDLQTASESLSKLLSNIQDPHLDPSNHDSFVDSVIHENEVNTDGNDTSNVVDGSESNCKEIQSILLSDEKSKTALISPSKYNLRSARKKLLQVDNESCNTDVQNTDGECSFFSNLDLRKNTITNGANTTTDSTKSEDELETKDERLGLIKIGGDTNESGETTSRVENDVTEPIGEPKIIRNFVKCAQYEEKVKNKLSEYDYNFYEDPDVDFESYDEEYSENSYYVTESANEAYIQNTILFRNPNKVSENDITFKLVIGKLEAVITDAYSSIQEFCVKCCQNLQSADIKVDKSEIEERAKNMYTFIGNICSELNSILSREKTSQNIFTLLNKKEFEDILVRDEDIDDYRNFIVNCLDQGNILKESIALILEASKD